MNLKCPHCGETIRISATKPTKRAAYFHQRYLKAKDLRLAKRKAQSEIKPTEGDTQC